MRADDGLMLNNYHLAQRSMPRSNHGINHLQSYQVKLWLGNVANNYSQRKEKEVK
jgi:hypothetical protein